MFDSNKKPTGNTGNHNNTSLKLLGNNIVSVHSCFYSEYTMSQAKDNARLKSYKNKSLNTEEMRRRREEEGLQLRKQKKDEQVRTVQKKPRRHNFLIV